MVIWKDDDYIKLRKSALQRKQLVCVQEILTELSDLLLMFHAYVTSDGSLERRFFIQNNYGGCSNDAGWFLVVEKDTCAWEQRTTRPYFLYSGLTGRDLQDSKISFTTTSMNSSYFLNDYEQRIKYGISK